MKTEWVMVRVRKETRERLARVAEQLQTALEQGKDACELGRFDTITVDEVIRVLLSRNERKQERARKSRKARKRVNSRPESTAGDTEG